MIDSKDTHSIRFSKKLSLLGNNVFHDMDVLKEKVQSSGKSLIDLSLGSSDLPTSPHILKSISDALMDVNENGYTLFRDTKDFRVAVSDWYEKKFGIRVDYNTEVLPLIGSQEGCAHLPLAILENGEFVLIQDPGYPAHAGGAYLAGGQVYPMPTLAENNFLPIFSDIPALVLEKSRMMILSYPHNPTSAIAPLSFFEEAVAFCQQHSLILIHDFPYADLYFGDQPVPSVFQADPERAVSIEFFTLSKSYNMGGFRIGYAIGNSRLIAALRQIKATIDFNQYRGILRGAITALTGPQDCVAHMVETFAVRRDTAVSALQSIGWIVPEPDATMYIWAKLPDSLPHGWSTQSIDFCAALIAQTGVAISPGRGFGKSGEGYVRFALVQPCEVLTDAIQKIGAFVAAAEHPSYKLEGAVSK